MTRKFNEGLQERWDKERDPFHNIGEDEAEGVLSSDQLQRILVKMIGDLCLLDYKEFQSVSAAYRILRQWDETPKVLDNSKPLNHDTTPAGSNPYETLPINAAYLAARDQLKEVGVMSQESFRKSIDSAVSKCRWIKTILPEF